MNAKCKKVFINDILSMLVSRMALRSTNEGPKHELDIPWSRNNWNWPIRIINFLNN